MRESFRSGCRQSGADQPGDRLGGLADPVVGLATPGTGGVHDAGAQVLLEQAEGHRLQRLGHRRDLGEDVDAVLLVLDHPLQPAGLALDAAQPLEVVVLAADVAVLVAVLGARLALVRPGLLDGLPAVPPGPGAPNPATAVTIPP